MPLKTTAKLTQAALACAQRTEADISGRHDGDAANKGGTAGLAINRVQWGWWWSLLIAGFIEDIYLTFEPRRNE